MASWLVFCVFDRRFRVPTASAYTWSSCGTQYDRLVTQELTFSANPGFTSGAKATIVTTVCVPFMPLLCPACPARVLALPVLHSFTLIQCAHVCVSTRFVCASVRVCVTCKPVTLCVHFCVCEWPGLGVCLFVSVALPECRCAFVRLCLCLCVLLVCCVCVYLFPPTGLREPAHALPHRRVAGARV